MSILIFNAGSNGRFGVELLSVSEIIKRSKAQRFPGMKPFINGVLDIRGRIVTIIDLPQLLLGATVDLESSSLVVLDKTQGDYALKVSAVDCILKDTAHFPVQQTKMRKYTKEVLVMDDASLVQMLDLSAVMQVALNGQPLR
jgi:purine-binding chemotaxis protein CheW